MFRSGQLHFSRSETMQKAESDHTGSSSIMILTCVSETLMICHSARAAVR